ncbi:hypothetical protein H257_13379 [Aphanomyces astaci]|uniref:Peptidase M28 domain-containing protein n=1 Tax=Aphanomyces astaci TaxID=112090 RepID=W4FWR8_APHAT|nr:hypothetical protein H257_13379 [Aphanomyces astaci]ETV71239.1 hypothetical protein H257_13379 [Aphanomyces astaci]|eukprot:XP_009839179.1 hypothetical protein H257_13379 [Aphanomyces astaci]
MIGYYKPGTTPVVAFAVDFSYVPLVDFLKKLVTKYLTIGYADRIFGYGASDHASWFRAGYPSSFPFEAARGNSNPYIHTSNDTLANINWVHVADFTKFSIAYVVELTQQTQSLNVLRSCRCHWGLKDDALASCEVEGHEALHQLFEAYVNSKVRSFLRCHRNVPLYWNDMLDYIHRDEKWLYMTNVDGWYYLCSGEDDPARMCQSKNRIIKMMFLTAMARPRYDNTKRIHWYGKICAWAFTSKCQALRNSKNRKRGDDVVEPTTVTREVYRDYVVNKVIPAIRSLWPRQRSSVIWIQQDDARPHVRVDDASVRMDG